MPLTLEPVLATRLQDFRNNVSETAEKIVFQVFPEKILHLQAMIDETNSESSIFHISHAKGSTDAKVYPPPTIAGSVEQPEPKRRKISAVESSNGSIAPSTNNGTGPVYPQSMLSNKHIRAVQERTQGEFDEMIQLCDKVKLWVNLTMPKIEDGDNFGVQIQEEVLNELARAQESAYNLRDSARAHHLTRAKICSKLIKYPNIEDYQYSLQDHDNKQLFMARQHLLDLRNVYAILSDILHKNIQKIRAPKGNNSMGMY